ncbi:MAG: DNA polymerase III subunit delta' [Phycisphaerae bacterium]
MRLADVLHQERAISILRRALRNGRAHHAYLFDGPEGVGKERTAIALAARLLCETPDLPPDADACGACRSCALLAGDNHPDFHLIHRGLHKLHPDRNVRATKGLFLTVDVIRHFLIAPASASPAMGRRRVFVIRDAERMNEEAQNALLKTLEEPPGAACLMLLSSSASRLLATIRSRCQRIPFGLLPVEFVSQRLVAQARIDAPAAQTLARLSDGRLGAALRWQRASLLDALSAIAERVVADPADDPEAFGKSLLAIAGELGTRLAEIGERADDAARGESGRRRGEPDPGRAGAAPSVPDEDDGGAPESAEREAGDRDARDVPTDQLRDGLRLVFAAVAALLRDALLAQIRVAAPRGLPAFSASADTLARAYDAERLEAAIESVVGAERMIDRNVAAQLACEQIALGLAGVEAIAE